MAQSGKAAHTSHELAHNLIAFAEWLKTRPDFELGGERDLQLYLPEYYDKESFVAAVRALGSGTKGNGILSDHMRFTSPADGPVKLLFEISRHKICRLVTPAREAVYECEPLLSPEEDAELGGGQ